MLEEIATLERQLAAQHMDRLDEAEQKLDAITSIERSIREQE